MKLEIEQPNILSLELKCYQLLSSFKNPDGEPEREAAELSEMILKERKLLWEWKDLMFAIANKL